MDPKKCTQEVFFDSPRLLSEHAIKLHGATFAGEEAHRADHRFSAAVKQNMELREGAAYKISHLVVFEHFHDERGYPVVRYFPTKAPRRHQENGHASLL